MGNTVSGGNSVSRILKDRLLKIYIDTPALYKKEFIKTVQETLSDSKSWAAQLGIAVIFIDRNPSDYEYNVFKIFLKENDEICKKCSAPGVEFEKLKLNCAITGAKIRECYINLYRWINGASESGLPLSEYRKYQINHEIGHLFGLDDYPQQDSKLIVNKNKTAPVMLQHTIGHGLMISNCWPLKSEIDKLLLNI